jgi:hypothetical protein
MPITNEDRALFTNPLLFDSPAAYSAALRVVAAYDEAEAENINLAALLKKARNELAEEKAVSVEAGARALCVLFYDGNTNPANMHPFWKKMAKACATAWGLKTKEGQG